MARKPNQPSFEEIAASLRNTEAPAQRVLDGLVKLDTSRPSISRRIIGYVGVALVICVLVATIPSTFLRSVDPSGAVFDGWGRQLHLAPFWYRMIYGDLWPGLEWWAAQMGAFFVGVAMASCLVRR